MNKVILGIGNSIKCLFREKINIAITLLVLNLILIPTLIIYVYLELSDGQYHFYMNTKKSLEQTHNAKFDSYDGAIAHELTTEEQLIRRQNRRWHLKYMFK